ncbi:hypothetical protein CPC08DRAFT_769194 [Agrocybe pediades]|nr:hypothetical protein CPC08DRAFT_769194 [Agrocybe pediades]
MIPVPRWSKNYSSLERKILRSHKEGYLKCTSPKARKDYVGRVVFPALCAAWRIESQETTIPDMPGKIKSLINWIRNNWRLTESEGTKVVRLNIKPSMVIAQLYKKQIDEELERLRDEARANGGDSRVIANWSRAVSNVGKSLTQEERQQVEREVERQSKIGLPVEAKRKIRHRFWRSRFDEAAQKNFLEMDLLSLDFIIERNKEGELEVHFHDKVAYLLGLPESFNMSSQATVAVTNFKNAIADYLVDLKKHLVKCAVMTGGKVTNPTGTETELMEGIATDWHPGGCIPEPETLWYIGQDQFPILKNNWDASQTTKLIFETTMRQYFGQHYFLATGKQRNKVPWEQLMGNEALFFNPDHLPAHCNLRPPRDMSKEAIVQLFQHILKRQEEYSSPIDAFRFKKIIRGRTKSSEIIPTMYDNDRAGDLMPPEPPKRRRQKRKKIPFTGRLQMTGQPTLEAGQLLQFDTNMNQLDIPHDAALIPPDVSSKIVMPTAPVKQIEPSGTSKDHNGDENATPTAGLSIESSGGRLPMAIEDNAATSDAAAGTQHPSAKRPMPARRPGKESAGNQNSVHVHPSGISSPMATEDNTATFPAAAGTRRPSAKRPMPARRAGKESAGKANLYMWEIYGIQENESSVAQAPPAMQAEEGGPQETSRKKGKGTATLVELEAAKYGATSAKRKSKPSEKTKKQ